MIAKVGLGLVLGMSLAGCASTANTGGPTLYPAGAYPIVSTFRSDTNPNGSARYRPHGGVDIRAPRGTAVLAAADGVVSAVRLGQPVSGNIITQDAGRLELLYAHLDSVLVREGDAVAAGQVIGAVGNTGEWVSKNEAPHLHFAVLGLFGRMDPETYLRDPETGLVRCPGPGGSEAAFLYPVACEK